MANDQTPQPPAAPEVHPSLGHQRSRTRNLSRAITGMALAVILAVTAAAAELSLDLWGRHAIYGRRLAQARMRLDEVNLADRQAIAAAATARSQFQRYEDLNTLLLAPDLQLTSITGVAPAASGVILFSPIRARALLTITGLSVLPPGRSYQLANLDQQGVVHPIMRFKALAEPVLVALTAAPIAAMRGRRLTINALLP